MRIEKELKFEKQIILPFVHNELVSNPYQWTAHDLMDRTNEQ